MHVLFGYNGRIKFRVLSVTGKDLGTKIRFQSRIRQKKMNYELSVLMMAIHYHDFTENRNLIIEIGYDVILLQ